jgi:hypothetical protein
MCRWRKIILKYKCGREDQKESQFLKACSQAYYGTCFDMT